MILHVFFCFSRRVSSSGLYGRRSSAQSRYFLIINIHNIGAKVRAVELTGKKSFHPSRILVIAHYRMAQGTPKMYSPRKPSVLIEAFRLYKDIAPLLFCAGSNGAALEHNVTKGPFLVRVNTRIHRLLRFGLLAMNFLGCGCLLCRCLELSY